MKSKPYRRLARLTTLISFLLGSIVFALYFFTSDALFIFIAYFYIIIAGITNLIICIYVIIKARNDPSNTERLHRSYGIMLLNIPAMLIYCYLGIMLLNTMRITFENNTGTDIIDVKITGCEEKTIKELKNGKSKTVWISIKGDCAISINYMRNGELTEEVVLSYVTNEGGHKTEYKIGGDNHQ